MGVEPTLSAWEAGVLPINYIRIFYGSIPCPAIKFKPLQEKFSQGLKTSVFSDTEISLGVLQNFCFAAHPFLYYFSPAVSCFTSWSAPVAARPEAMPTAMALSISPAGNSGMT